MVGYRHDYEEVFDGFLKDLPRIAWPLLEGARDRLILLEDGLYGSVNFINLLKSSFPIESLKPVLSSSQAKRLAEGSVEFLRKKDGSILPILVDPETKKFIGQVSLAELRDLPDMSQAIVDFSSYIKLAQIAKELKEISTAISRISRGLEDDRLAMAYSCEQKLIQARSIENKAIRERMLIQVVSDAEDSRNLLMLSQKRNIEFLKAQPQTLVAKFINGEKSEKIEQRLNEIRTSLRAMNIASLAQALAYMDLGEIETARLSLRYFARFLDETYTGDDGLLERLEGMDPILDSYWRKKLVVMKDSINSLPIYEKSIVLGGNYES